MVESNHCRRETSSATSIINTWEVIAGQSEGTGVALDQREDGVFPLQISDQDLV